jgi:hypothetical protein
MPFARIVRAVLLVPATLATISLATTTGADGAAVACRVDYTITTQWPGGFGTNIVTTNLGDPLSGWTLEWTFAGRQKITSESWNGVFTQTGGTVRVRNADYNAAVATGASVTLGFNGTWSDTNPVPTSFRLNGVPCTGLPTAATPTTVTEPPPAAPPTTTHQFVLTTTTVAPPETTQPTTTEPPPAQTPPDTFEWPTTVPKSTVVLSADEESLNTETVLVRLVIALLLLSGGIVLLLEIRRRLPRS